jgi:hypothetical protein
MSLEKRIETIEHEMKILKNEIESTLLEIQNQILIHYYPSLRAEDPSSPKEISLIAETPLEDKRDEAQRRESAGRRPMNNDAYTAPRTREVSLDELTEKSKQVSIVRTEQPAAAKEGPVPWPEAVISQAALTHIAKWVNEAVEKIGKVGAQNMIESHAGTEHCTPEVKDVLLQFISLSEEDNPPQQVTTKVLMDILLKLNKMLDQVTLIS